MVLLVSNAHVHLFNPDFFILLAEKSPEKYPKHKGCCSISELFAFIIMQV